MDVVYVGKILLEKFGINVEEMDDDEQVCKDIVSVVIVFVVCFLQKDFLLCESDLVVVV